MHSYYDREALDEQFGGAAGKEQMMDATQGLGPGRRDPKSGRLMRWDRKTKEHVPITEKEIKTVYANGPEIADPFA